MERIEKCSSRPDKALTRTILNDFINNFSPSCSGEAKFTGEIEMRGLCSWKIFGDTPSISA